MREERRAKQKLKQDSNVNKKGKGAKGSPAATKPKPPATKEDEADRQRKKLEKHLRKAEKLREQLKRAEIGNEGTATSSEMANTEQETSHSGAPTGEAFSSTQADPSSEGQVQLNRKEDVSMSESSDSSSSDDSSDSDSDAAPEVQTSKSKDKQRDTRMPKQPRGNNRTNTEVPCKYFLRDGNCRRKDCRFLHNVAPKPKEKMTLYDRVSSRCCLFN
jgi:hypothetical protein